MPRPLVVLLVKTGVEVCIIGPFDNMGLALAHAVNHVAPLGLEWQIEPLYATLAELRASTEPPTTEE